MLTSLDFLKVGQSFPPKSEIERLDKYNKNKLIFEGKHEQVYYDSFKRIARVVSNFQEVVSYSVIANYQKLISLKVADLMLGEAPRIVVGEDNSKQQKAINEISNNSDLTNTLYTSVLDLSRYGDSVFLVYKEDNQAKIDITQPSYYFKVVDERNIRKVVNHVLAHTYEVEVTGGLFSKEKKKKYLYCQIHYKGFYEEFTCELNEQNIIVSATETKRIKTGLNDFAVVPVHNLLTSDRSYGLDDYSDLDSIISEIEVRISQISKILDKHAEPSMQGTENALQWNEHTNSYEFKNGNYLPLSDGDTPVSYITWDAQLQANFEVIEKLINVLATVSEMGSALFDTQEKQGQVASGTALRRMMISPLAKVNRVRLSFDSAIKKALFLASQLANAKIDFQDINIIWNDGLPNDPKEEAEVMAIRTGNKATLSQWSAIQRLDSLNDEDTTKELEAIKQDEVNNNPLSNMNFDYGQEENSSSLDNEVVDE